MAGGESTLLIALAGAVMVLLLAQSCASGSGGPVSSNNFCPDHFFQMTWWAILGCLIYDQFSILSEAL